jgi:hypothetical protein
MGSLGKRPSRAIGIGEELKRDISYATLNQRSAGRTTVFIGLAMLGAGLFVGGVNRERIERANRASERVQAYTTLHCRVLETSGPVSPYAPADALALDLPLLCAGQPERRNYLPFMLLGIPLIAGAGMIAYKGLRHLNDAERLGHEEACIENIIEQTRYVRYYSKRPVSQRSARKGEREA